MSFIGDMFDSKKGSGFQAVNPSVDQLNSSYAQTQSGLQNQQDFVNALNAQNGLGNQGSVFGQQQGLANQLQGVANGTGPNPALAQLQHATGQNVANQSALMAGQRGSGANAGLMARLAAQQGGNIQQQAVGQGATMQAQQQLAAMQQLQNQQANMGNLANNQVGQQQTGLNAYNTAALQQQANLYGLQSNANTSNAAIAGGNQRGQQGMFGGMMGGLGSAMGGMFGGGGGGGASGGMSMAGGAGDTMGGASEMIGEGATMVAAHGGMVPNYAAGGEVASDPLMQPIQNVQIEDSNADTPQSNVGRMLSSNIASGFGTSGPGVPATSGGGSGGGMGGGMGDMAGLAGKGLMQWGEHEALPYLQNFFGGMLGAGGALATTAGPTMAGGAGDAIGAAAPEMVAGAATAAPVVAAAAHGGVIGEQLASQGRQVPGRATAPGDSQKNDVVPAKLSPGEIIIPRSIAMHPNAPAEAAKFVAHVLSQNKNMACGGSVQHFADGGQARNEKPVSMPDPQKAKEAWEGAQHGQSFSEGWENAKKFFGAGNDPQQVKGYWDGGMPSMQDVGEGIGEYLVNPLAKGVGYLGQKAIDTAKGMGNTAGQLTQGLERGTGAYLPGSSVNPNAPTQSSEAAPEAAPSNYALDTAPRVPQQAAPQGSDPFKGYNPTQGYSTQMAGVQQEFGKPGDKEPGGIQGQIARQEALAHQQQAQTMQDLQSQTQANMLEHDKEIRSAIGDMQSNKINPNAYINNMGTGQKVSTAIGLILGGIGGGITGQENPALKFLQKNIDNDIEAQKANLGQKNNILSAYERLYGDKQTALSMTKALLLGQTEEKLKSEISKRGDQLSQARGQQALGAIQTEYQKALYDASMRKTMMQGMNSGNPEGTMQAMRYLNPGMAKDMESRYVPGVGMAAIPIPETGRAQLTLRNELDQKLQKLEAFSSKHSGTVADRAVVNKGKALAADVQDVYRRANQQGVFKESESDFIKNMVSSDPTEFFSKYRALPGYKTTRESNRSALQNLYKSYGLKASMPQFNPR